jgi:hypothetical protein
VKPAIVGVVLVAIALAIVMYIRRDTSETPTGPAKGSGSAAPITTTAGSATAPPAKPDHVRRLSAADRKQLGEQIAAARAKARAAAAAAAASSTSGGPKPELDDHIQLEQVADGLVTAMKESIPILAECYDQAYGADAGAKRTALVKMEMTSDPDLGTVIDDTAMTDADGKKLEPKLDECLRNTIESLALPPFDVGGRLEVQYSFDLD